MLILGVYVGVFVAARSMDNLMFIVIVVIKILIVIGNTVSTTCPFSEVVGFTAVTAKRKRIIITLDQRPTNRALNNDCFTHEIGTIIKA